MVLWSRMEAKKVGRRLFARVAEKSRFARPLIGHRAISRKHDRGGVTDPRLRFRGKHGSFND